MEDNKSPTAARENQLARSVQRGEQRLAQLRLLEKRFTWYRLVAFIGGSAISWLALTRLSTPYSFLIPGVAVALFVLVLSLHRRLSRWIERFLSGETCAAAAGAPSLTGSRFRLPAPFPAHATPWMLT
jgi:hypothetical protein